ncbi:Hypothetical protein POVR1_LOCUS51 [uncultured virus]|nr:Hypothetical protein POVR1_LOCUS51 [uncultured virus]
METDVRKVVDKIGALDHEASGKYSVLAVYLNRQLTQGEKVVEEQSMEEPLYGIVIPCGSFKKKERAEEQAGRISAVSGAPVIITCETGQPVPLSFKHSTNAVVYQRDPEKSIRDLQKSIDIRRQEIEEINQRKIQEQKDRSTDPNSIHNYIQNIYLCTRQCQKLEEFQKLLEETKKTYEESLTKLQEFEKRNAELIHTWKDVAKPRLRERNELNVYNEMTKWHDEHKKI